MSNSDMPAFPVAKHFLPTPGITKRELLAAMALQGILPRAGTMGPLAIAAYAVEYADALMAALEKRPQTNLKGEVNGTGRID